MQTKQHHLWLLAAVAAPAAHFSGCGWLTALCTAAAILPLSLLNKDWSFSKPVALIQICWLGVVAGAILPGSATNWPSSSDLAVPLTLLTLGALTRAAHAPRVGAVLAFCMGFLSLPLALSTAAHLETEWLRPTPLTWAPGLALALLLPGLPGGEAGKGRAALAIGALTTAVAALVQGVLSPGVAAEVSDVVYQTARALGHMEPVAAAAMTLGWYAAASLLFSAAAEIAGKSQIKEKLSHVLLWGTAATLILLEWQLSATFLVVLSGFMWCFTPFFQKMKKVKNSA